MLRTLGPESSLQRGYSITFDARGNILRSAQDAVIGEKIITRLANGTLESMINKVDRSND
jgi:exonuclease VII large subunit